LLLRRLFLLFLLLLLCSRLAGCSGYEMFVYKRCCWLCAALWRLRFHWFLWLLLLLLE